MRRLCRRLTLAMTVARRILRGEVGPLILLGIAVPSAWIVVAATGSRTPIDDNLTLIVALLVIAVRMARESEDGAFVAASIPLMLTAALVVPNERLRFLCYGVVFAAALASTVAVLSRREKLHASRATAIVMLAVAPMKMLPLEDLRFSSLLLLVGVLLLATSLFAKRQNVPPVLLALVVMIAGATPIEPTRAVLYPLLLASLVWWLRSPSHLGAIWALALGTVMGKWAVLLVIIPMAFEAIARRSERVTESSASPLLAVLPLRVHLRTIALALGPLLAVPSALTALFRVSRATKISALLIIAIGTALRPWVATAWVLGAAVVALSRADLRRRDPLAQVSGVVALLVVALFAWSGVAVAFFPLPIPMGALLAVALLAAFPAVLPWPRMGGIVVMAAFFALVMGAAGFAGTWWSGGDSTTGSLARGESMSIRAPDGRKAIDLVLSGVNLAERKEGDEVGRVEILDRKGHAWRRTLRMGDLADWGAFRPSMVFGTWNAVPRRSAGEIAGFGVGAWRRGDGFVRVAIDAEIDRVVVVSSENLASGERINVERVRFER